MVLLASTHPGFGFQSAGRFRFARVYWRAHLHMAALEEGTQSLRSCDADTPKCSMSVDLNLLEKREAPEPGPLRIDVRTPKAASNNTHNKHRVANFGRRVRLKKLALDGPCAGLSCVGNMASAADRCVRPGVGRRADGLALLRDVS